MAAIASEIMFENRGKSDYCYATGKHKETDVMAETLIGLIGGSGLGDELGRHIENSRSVAVATPFGKPSAEILVGKIGRNRIAFLNRHGDGHKFSPSEVPYAANIFALKKLGVKTVISSGAVGSLRDKIKPGDLVIVDQFIDKTFKRPNSFFVGYGAVHSEMARPVSRQLAGKLWAAAKEAKVRAHPSGTYVCMEGPQFSTRAESLMHRVWGGDLIGMTAMPEAKLAREAQMCYGMVALISDYDCWKPAKQVKNKQRLLEEILGNLKMATDNCLSLIKTALLSTELACDDEYCRRSLELAVWTDPRQISSKKKERLKVLFE